MPTSRAPTVRQLRLGAALRRLREDQSLSAEQVGLRLRWSASKVSRIENARIGARESDVKRLLKLYRAEERVLHELLGLARAADSKGWWADFPELRGDMAEYIAMEDEADSVIAFESQVVHGLLQTEEYAHCLILGWDEVISRPPGAIRQDLAVRLRRQQLIQPPRSLRLSVVLDEAVLLRRVGDAGVMRRQLDHLVELSGLPNIELRLLPLDADHGAALATFTVLQYASAYEVMFPDVVHTESRTAVLSQDETMTHEYRRAFDWLSKHSLEPERSTEAIRRISDDRWQSP